MHIICTYKACIFFTCYVILLEVRLNDFLIVAFSAVEIINGKFNTDTMTSGSSFQRELPFGWSRLCCDDPSGNVVIVAAWDKQLGGMGAGSSSSSYYVNLQTNGVDWVAIGQNVTLPPLSTLEVSFYARSRPFTTSTGLAVSFGSEIFNHDLFGNWGYYVVMFPHLSESATTDILKFSGRFQECELGWDCSYQISSVSARAIREYI